MNARINVLFYTIVSLFAATVVVTLLGVLRIVDISPDIMRLLVPACLVELTAAVYALLKKAPVFDNGIATNPLSDERSSQKGRATAQDATAPNTSGTFLGEVSLAALLWLAVVHVISFHALPPIPSATLYAAELVSALVLFAWRRPTAVSTELAIYAIGAVLALQSVIDRSLTFLGNSPDDWRLYAGAHRALSFASAFLIATALLARARRGAHAELALYWLFLGRLGFNLVIAPWGAMRGSLGPGTLAGVLITWHLAFLGITCLLFLVRGARASSLELLLYGASIISSISSLIYWLNY